ncbi:MAG: hypothetical protein Q7S40_02565 [Opitutaceae bacterium]|nr:hypothetical protein [Opitutaceae bacterium]
MQQSPANAVVSKQARDALVALGETPATGLSIRRVALPFSVDWTWDFSADGRYVAYGSRLRNEDILVGELATGKSWMAFHGVKDKEYPSTNALISPDNRSIAFDVDNKDGGAGIYVANLDGSERRKIYACDPKAEWIFLLAWSPEGNRVLAGYSTAASANGDERAGRMNSNWSVVSIDVRTGVKSEFARPANRDRNRDTWVLSPDARLLARRKGDYPRTITVLNLASGREEVVVDRDANRVVGWLPNSKRLVFSKDGTDGVDLWAVNLEDGKPTAPSEKIWSNLGAGRQPSVERDGNLYYHTRQNNKPDSYELWVMEGFHAAKPAATKTESWRIQTDIPADEMIIGADNSVLDRKFGFGATLPSGWSVSSAVRQGNGGTVVQFQSTAIREARARSRIIYWPTTPWANPGSPANDFAASGAKPTTPEEIDAWLRNRLQMALEVYSKGTLRDHMTTHDSYTSRVINEHHAAIVTGRFTQNGKPWREVNTLVYSDKLIATCQFSAPEEKFDQIRPSYDRLAESIRLP